MTTPILLVTGFLGAGKTTMINALLQGRHGERIAAIVNDFGAINIDEALLGEVSETVIGLKNGCICCSLQGDLLRTLRLVLAHDPAPQRIVIEASGAADPRGIIEMIMDPVLWGAVSLETVVCLVDAEDLAETPARGQDPLWQAQLRYSDFAFLSKTKGLSTEALGAIRARLSAERKPVFDLDAEGLPETLLLGENAALRQKPEGRPQHADRFVTTEWHSPTPVSLAAFQGVLQQVSQGLLRAKGFMRLRERPKDVHLFQLVGRRATFAPHPARADLAGAELVLIGEAGIFSASAVQEALERLQD